MYERRLVVSHFYRYIIGSFLAQKGAVNVPKHNILTVVCLERVAKQRVAGVPHLSELTEDLLVNCRAL